MSVGNVNLKNYTTILQRVEESFNSARERDGNNFYQRQDKDKQEELPQNEKDLFTLISQEVEKFKNQPHVKEQGVQYLAIKDGKNVYVAVKSNTGELIRKIPPVEFLKICKAPAQGNKGNILNSVM